MKSTSILLIGTCVIAVAGLVACAAIAVLVPALATNTRSISDYDLERKSSIAASFVSPSNNLQREPAISGTKVVWSEKIDGYWQIILFDFTDNSRQQLTFDPVDHIYPSVSGNVIIWWQGEPGNPSRVNGIRYPTGQELVLPVTRVVRPRAGSTYLVWISPIDLTTLASTVMQFNVDTQKEVVIATSADANWPSSSESVVVWRDMRNGNADIYGYDLETAREFPISVGPGNQDKPVISGNIIVWQDDRNGSPTNHAVFGYDLRVKHEFVISARGGDEVDPSISGDIVVWADYVGSNLDVYGYNLRTQRLFTIAANDLPNGQPAVSGSMVVWTRWENSSRDALSQIMITDVSFALP